MSRLLKKLSIKNGDILALKHQSENANKFAIDHIVAAFEQLKIDALVVVVDNFDDLTVLNEQEMNKRGWFHLDKIAKLIKIPPKEKQ